MFNTNAQGKPDRPKIRDILLRAQFCFKAGILFGGVSNAEDIIHVDGEDHSASLCVLTVHAPVTFHVLESPVSDSVVECLVLYVSCIMFQGIFFFSAHLSPFQIM